jgi:hypothetical protein
MAKKNNGFVTITNEDVYKELQKQGKIQQKILEHAEYTNGKIASAVAEIEKLKRDIEHKVDKAASLGYWIRSNTIKSMASAVLIVLLLITETRAAAIQMIAKIFI